MRKSTHPHPIQTSEIDGAVVHYPRGEGRTVRALFRAADDEGVIQAEDLGQITGRYTTSLLGHELARVGAWEDHDNDFVYAEARRIARRALDGVSEAGDWRRAGYRSRYAAAWAMVADGPRPECMLAAAIIAGELR